MEEGLPFLWPGTTGLRGPLILRQAVEEVSQIPQPGTLVTALP